jgi:hypothetical protein
MGSIEHFETTEGRGVYRPQGSASAWQLADLITEALEHASATQLREILINISSMSGFEAPGPAYRRWAVRRWASTLRPRIPLVIVARRDHICPEKVGLLVAAEEGLDAHICETEAEAASWLQAMSSSEGVWD